MSAEDNFAFTQESKAFGIFTNYRHCDPPSKSTKTDWKSQGDRVQREEKERRRKKKKEERKKKKEKKNVF